MIYKFKDYKKSEILRNHLNLGGENPNGERIDVTSLYFERGGKPWMPHMFVSDFGDILAPMEYVESENKVGKFDTKSLRYCMRTDGNELRIKRKDM